MNTRRLGDTGLVVSRIGLGLAALGRPGYLNLGHADDLERDYDRASMEERTHAVLDYARRAGVRYFDAARSYGRAEDFLGSWLRDRGIASAEATIGSKWGYTYTAGWRVDAETHEVKDHSAAVLRRQIAESRARLGAHLALYQIHSATLESGVLDRTDVLDELVRLRDSGLRIGLSVSGTGQAGTIARALAIRRGNCRLFDCVQATWNVLETSCGKMLATAHDAGVGVIVKEALANGRLTERNRDPGFSSPRAALARLAGLHATTIDAIALAAVLAEPFVDVVLSGAATIGQLRSNLRALEVTLDDAARSLLGSLAERPESYWETRTRLRWN
jgi:aryl-alcohol dehydrogenase-like predicted oxidoreductase